MSFMFLRNGEQQIITQPGNPVPQADAEKVYGHIDKLIEDGFDLTPTNLVEDARKEDSVLHPYFEWDNSEAGEAWRRQQARFIVNRVKVVVIDTQAEKEVEVRKYLSVVVHQQSTHDEDGGDTDEDDATNDKSLRSYKRIETVVSTPDLRRQVIDQALREARSWRKRYNTYSELQPVIDAIDALGDTD